MASFEDETTTTHCFSTPTRETSSPLHRQPQEASNNVNLSTAYSMDSPVLDNDDQPVRYVDERTKALGRKAELEELRQRKELGKKKAAFNQYALSPSTSTLASFFQQQKMRRARANQLRMGALSSLNQYRLKDCDLLTKKKAATSSKQQHRHQYSPTIMTPCNRDVHAPVDFLDFLGGADSTEWREQKQSALQKLQTYRQHSQSNEKDGSTETTKQTAECNETSETTAIIHDSLWLVHTELKGFFTGVALASEAEEDMNLDNTASQQQLLEIHQDEKKEDDPEIATAAAAVDVREKTKQQESLLLPSLAGAKNLTNTQAETDSFSWPDDKEVNSTSNNDETPSKDQPSGFDNVASNSIEDHRKDIELMQASLSFSKSCLSQDDDEQPQSDNHSSSIENHMKDIAAMQASLSFSTSPKFTQTTITAQQQETPASPQQLLDPMCGPRQSFVSEILQHPQTTSSHDTSPRHQQQEQHQQEEITAKDYSHKSSTASATNSPDNNAATFTLPARPRRQQGEAEEMIWSSQESPIQRTTTADSSISSIGSSIEQSAVGDNIVQGGDGGGTTLSRQSSSSSLSSFWQQDLLDGDKKNSPNKNRRDNYNDKLLICCSSEQYLPNLHTTKGACERCFAVASKEERAKFRATGRHVRIMLVRGGCHRSCTAYPRDPDQPPVRLCRKCYFDCHRAKSTK